MPNICIKLLDNDGKHLKTVECELSTVFAPCIIYEGEQWFLAMFGVSGPCYVKPVEVMEGSVGNRPS